eukprot:3596359-Prymnesium_polylepis.1
MLWLWETIKSLMRASREDRARLCGTGCDGPEVMIAALIWHTPCPLWHTPFVLRHLNRGYGPEVMIAALQRSS